MLTALLLVLTPSATPCVAPESFLLRQEATPQGEPDLRWDGETEDVYRRALHLWKVRGKPGEAADLLLGIADSEEVLQIAGQSSWVLVLAAQCLAEAGRGEEAAALIPGIERGAKGTRLETAVVRELTGLNGLLAPEVTSLDPTFLNALVETLSKSDYSGAREFVRNFGRPALPYLIHCVESWQAGALDTASAQLAVNLGLQFADRHFVDRLIALCDGMSDLTFLAVAKASASMIDDQAATEAWRFWRHMAETRTAESRLRAIEMLALLLKLDHSVLRQGFQEWSANATNEDLIHCLRSTIGSTSRLNDWYLPLVRRGGQVRTHVLVNMFSTGGLDCLAILAREGDLQAAACYVAATACAVASGYGAEVWGKPSWDKITELALLELGWQGDSVTPQLTGRYSPGSPDAGKHPPGFEGFGLLEGEYFASAARSQLALFASSAYFDEDLCARILARGVPCSLEELAAIFRGESARLLPDAELWALDPEPLPARGVVPHLNLLLANQNNVGAEAVVERLPWLREKGGIDYVIQRFASSDRRHEIGRLLTDPACDASLLAGALRGLSEKNLKAGDEEFARHLVRFSADLPSLNQEQAVGIVKFLSRCDELGLPVEQYLSEQVLSGIYEARFRHNFGNITDCLLEAPAAPAALEAFCSDRERTLSLVNAVAQKPRNVNGHFALLCLRNGLAGSEFSFNHLGFGSITSDLAAAREAVEILFERGTPYDQRSALVLLERNPELIVESRQYLRSLWQDPAMATDAARVLLRFRFLDDGILELALGAWNLPLLTNRGAMVDALAATGEPRVIPVLLAALHDADVEVVEKARNGLQRLKDIEEQRAFWESWQATGVGGSPEAALLKQVRSENREVRLAAIRALGALQSKNALPLLISLLEDPDQEVVAAARAALAWMTQAPGPAADSPAADSGESGG